ncbi:hypothetical protein L1987_32576 [Smallanthus sonchifolius]|uniref:Uncharacterized protein n=1 Tax=Smallanthus sonchifolius TaxID=185202 RepID=A0ACB9HPX9_9ASTR|nr:hypothetical protein L1987_32576 [Smallanthus sonchifolius]
MVFSCSFKSIIACNNQFLLIDKKSCCRYHDNAFVTSRALHIVNELNASATYHLLNAFFKHQERFYNAQTSKMSREAVLDKVIDFASTTIGNSMQSAIKSGFNDSTTDIKTRVSFKYGCSRGVYGTPFFFVNGFMIPFNDSHPIDYNGWRKIIDPLRLKRRTSKPEKRAVPSLSYHKSIKQSQLHFDFMDRYHKVEKPRAEQPIDENEIRITSQGRMRNYITYAISLLQEKGSSEIVFKAMGRAINKTVTIVELIKRRVVGLHQSTTIGSIDITDTWEPLEEGLLPLETTRHVSLITVTLSKNELNTSSIGYQPPLPADQVKVATEFEYDGEGSPTARGRGRGGRGRGRGRSRATMPGEYEDGGWDAPRDFTRGRGRGRGRNFRGRGRGGYSNNGPYVDDQYDGGYNQEALPMQQGRGRGRGRGARGRGRGFRSNGPTRAAAGDGDGM